ncbi:MAG TPA: N4-gp56 family major capsid protein [Sphingomicrobium sp.]
MPMTTYSDISPRTNVYAARGMLKNAQPQYVLARMGTTKPMPKNSTDTIKFRRWVPFSASTVPLVEGVTPSAQQMSKEDVSVQLRQYGNFVTVTDWIEDTHEDPVLQGAVEELGKQAGASDEQICYNAVKGGTTVAYANGSARTDVNTPVSLNKIRSVVNTLQRNKAMKITKVLDGSPDYNTYPVEAAYIAVGHVDLAPDIRNIQGFTPVAEYGSRKTVSEFEIGCVEDVRFVLSADLSPFTDAGGAKAGSGTTMRSTTGTSADVYPIIVMGEDFFAHVPLRGAFSLKAFIVNRKSSDSDPLAQRGHVGYKFAKAALILNESWGCRLEVAATSLS